MAESIDNNGKKQKLLTGSAAGAQVNRPQLKKKKAKEETIVASASERRYLWTARAFAIVTIISICCNFVLFITIMQLIPLYRVEPFLLTFQNKEEQVYNIVPLQGRMEDRKSITEAFVREYVLNRSSFSVDIPEMEARWMPGGIIQEMSTSVVYSDFLEKTAKRALDIIKKKGLVRDVRILTVNELDSGLWQVEYETQDMYPNSSAPEINYWTASLKIAYRKKTVKYGERMNNPVGFTVVRYSLMHNKVK